ncbi:thiamine pyrophosphate enzyme, N-terminal TPP-binding domain-containing protein [Cupriavidus basilensis OR16]|uniref:Thiamine pyrophosphate enzyme, N-terminal TPP-binding domain-containing protein n=1 Tax=Cupriavidus basilensis OR16 TaxID=1127483 RepID=H1S5T9_9BURK|nr:thiamine pyrophosphate-binding protein [Cupriavidus basilensis]EHP42171.1 thiamine pyrophosphate enzyme, N-terminal TPP-binding domain-containing protein [Cupriavidus basilensis OR16]
MTVGNHSIAASAYVEALRASRVDHFVTVPDWVQWALHARMEAGVDGIREVMCCNEDQAVTVAAGLTIGGKRPIVVVQNQGLYACVNTIRAIALDARIPTVFLVGQFGREFSNFGGDPAASRRNMVRLLEPVLDALDVPCWRLEAAADLRHIDAAFDAAHARGGAAALIVGAPIAWH